MILAINTSTPQFSIALLQQSGSLLADEFVTSNSKNFRAFMPALDSLLERCGCEIKDIKTMAVAVGPGSFTGLRVGLSLAKGICQGLGIPVVGVSSLEALASQWPDATMPICSVIDSRKGEVFAGLFRWDHERLRRLKPDTSLALGELAGFVTEPSFILGNDFDRQEKAVRQILGQRGRIVPSHCWGLRASSVGMLGLTRGQEKVFDSLPNLVPSYLRRPDIRPSPYPPERIIS